MVVKIRGANMKRSFLTAGFLSISLILPNQANAAIFSKIYAFGDSLSDTGNVSQVTEALLGFPFPPPPYFQGRFSNGPIWVEDLATKLGIKVESLAFGGATTGNLNTLDATLPVPLPGLEQEINNFVLAHPLADPNALYTLWAGANDYLPTNSLSFKPYNTPDTSLSHIKMAVEDLVKIGAKKIMVLNLPDLGKLPKTRGLNSDGFCPPKVDAVNDADCLNQLTASHNAGLSTLFSSLPSDVRIIPVDVNSLIDNAIDNPGQFGFTNVTEACFVPPPNTSLCSNPDRYLFWDNQHPSSKGHALVAQLAFKALSVPEPSTLVSLVTFGVLAISTLRCQTNKK
jgi:phospholipase/lecithinase/hemolysin